MKKLPPIDWFDSDAVRDALVSFVCRCGAVGATVTLPAREPHWAVATCSDGCWLGWVAGPQRPEKKKATRRYSSRLTRLDEDRCLLCQRTRVQAETMGTRLVPHHIIDRALLIDAGLEPDELKYLSWACGTPCHTFITALRVAFVPALALLEAGGIVTAAELDLPFDATLNVGAHELLFGEPPF